MFDGRTRFDGTFRRDSSGIAGAIVRGCSAALDETVADALAETVAKVGESIEIRRFSRFALGDDGGSDE